MKTITLLLIGIFITIVTCAQSTLIKHVGEQDKPIWPILIYTNDYKAPSSKDSKDVLKPVKCLVSQQAYDSIKQYLYANRTGAVRTTAEWGSFDILENGKPLYTIVGDKASIKFFTGMLSKLKFPRAHTVHEAITNNILLRLKGYAVE